MIATTLDVVRAAVVAVQPPSDIAAFDTEHPEAAIRARYGFHSHSEPLDLGLILVLQAQLRTNLVGTKLQAQLTCPYADVCVRRTVFEAEFGHRDVNKVNLCFLARHRKGWLTEDVVAPVADAHSRLLDSFAEIVGRPEAGTELDRAPGLPDLYRCGDKELTRQKALYALYSAELISHRFHLPERCISVLHDTILS